MKRATTKRLAELLLRSHLSWNESSHSQTEADRLTGNKPFLSMIFKTLYQNWAFQTCSRKKSSSSSLLCLTPLSPSERWCRSRWEAIHQHSSMSSSTFQGLIPQQLCRVTESKGSHTLSNLSTSWANEARRQLLTITQCKTINTKSFHSLKDGK